MNNYFVDLYIEQGAFPYPPHLHCAEHATVKFTPKRSLIGALSFRAETIDPEKVKAEIRAYYENVGIKIKRIVIK